MALIVKDRVKETTTATGTGQMVLDGASTGFQSFSVIGENNQTYYTIVGGSQWEVGIGVYEEANTTLYRETVLSNSLGTTAKINFSAGTKDVFCTYPADKAVLSDTSVTGSIGSGALVLSNSPTISTSLTVDGTLNLTGNALNNQSIATAQTTGNLTIGGTAQTTGTISMGGTSATGAITLGQSTEAQTVNIATGINTAAAKIVNIGTEGTGSTTTINIGSTSGSTTTVAVRGTLAMAAEDRNVVLNTIQTTGTITAGGTAGTGAITIGQSTGAQNINISNGASSTSIVNIGGTGLSTGNINIGRSTGAQTISIGSGAIGSTVQGTAIRTINIGTTTVASGVSNVNIGKTASTVDHTTTINGRYINLNAGTALSLGSADLGLPIRINQSVDIVENLIPGVTGSRAFVTDAFNPVVGQLVNGGGSIRVPVYYDGTNWICDSGLGTTSGTGNVVLATSPTLTNPTFTGYTETVYAVVDAAGVPLSPTNGTIQTWTLGANRTPTAGTWNAGQSMTLMISDNTAFTITWTTIGVVWVGGTAPALATTGFTVLEFWKVGSTIYGAFVGYVA